jgi:hypothetical protein
MSIVDRYLPAGLSDANTEEVGLVLAKAAQAAKRPDALEEFLNSGPLSPEFSDAIRGRNPSAEPERKNKGLNLL